MINIKFLGFSLCLNKGYGKGGKMKTRKHRPREYARWPRVEQASLNHRNSLCY